MKKLLQLALITGSLLTGTLCAADEHTEPEAASAAAPAYPVATQATWSSDEQALFNAVVAGNLSTVQRLHTERPGILQTRFSGKFDGLPRDPDGSAWELNQHTILHVAARIDQVHLIDWLVTIGSLAVDTTNEYGGTSLHSAAGRNALAAAEKLITLGANVDAPNIDQWTPLHIAAEKGHANVAELLLRHGTNVNAQEIDQWTPLHFAAQDGHANVAKVLLRSGATINAQNKDQCTPLYIAAQNGHANVAELLLNKGANVHVQTNTQETPLIVASLNNHQEVTKLLLKKHHALVNMKGPADCTALQAAVESGHLALARILLKHSANVNAQASRNLTPLHSAAGLGYTEVAQLLIDYGALINAQNSNHRTPLHFAIQENRHATAATLIAHHAEVDAQDNEGRTALEIAVENKHPESIRLLLQHGANIDIHRDGQLTPFHLAVSAGDVTIARIFFEQRPSLDLMAPINDNADTLLHLAQRNGHTTMAQLLLHRGARNSRNDARELAITVAFNDSIIHALTRTLAALAGLSGPDHEIGVRWVDGTHRHPTLPVSVINRIFEFAGDLIPPGTDKEIMHHGPTQVLTRYRNRLSAQIAAIAAAMQAHERGSKRGRDYDDSDDIGGAGSGPAKQERRDDAAGAGK